MMTKSLEERFHQHKSQASQNNDINKYEKEKFIIYSLEKCKNKQKIAESQYKKIIRIYVDANKDIFNSMKEAAAAIDAYPQGISGVCRSIKKSYKNYKWKYLEGLN